MSMNSRLIPVLALAAAMLAPVPASVQAQTAAPRSRAPVTVNFINADIEAVTRAFAAMMDRAILVDPRVKGQITVYSDQPQSVGQAFQAYQTALRGLGFSIVESGGLLKVVPEADAKLQTTTVSVGPNVAPRGDQVITQVFTLAYENPNNLVAVLRPLITANNTINANAGNSTLVITDYADNLQRLAKIIAALDRPAGTDLEVIPLQNAVAADLAPLIQRMTDGGGPTITPGAATINAGGVTVVADSRSNSLYVRAPNAARMAQLKATIAELDRPSQLIGPNGGMWVVHLKNADAVRLATVVRAAFSALGGGSGQSGAAAAISAQPTTPTLTRSSTNTGGGAGNAEAGGTLAGVAAPSTGGFIQADPATNSLVITAPEPLYRQVRALIDELDVRRAQVYIESMIVEVSGNDAADFGFQWQGLLGKSGDQYGLAGGTNFTSSSGSGNLITLDTAAKTGTISLGQGLNVGLLKAYGKTITLAAIANALQSVGNTNIVSTPNLITLDNEEAKIVVGQNVPFITGQFTNTGTATTSPFQTIERKDVGITLRIKPQIGENGAIRMTIFQEQSAVLATTAAGTSNAGPSTTKRSIEGTVTVDDGQILVLGGLIEDNVQVTQSKVPLLGDIPVLGALFRSESRQRTRTNLMVFLRPVVMRDAEAARQFSEQRYDLIRGQQQGSQPAPSFVTPINQAPVLPLRPSTAAPATELSPAAAASAAAAR
ncbi:MAG: type II secretion system secretin GspD [Burkholderiales bacterium]|nr:type II secretion system secretin GspD [Burkholderiales bacterium]